MELDRLAEASPMPRRRVAFADLSNSAERAATLKIVNQREAGGRMTRDARFMNDLLLVPNGMPVAQRVPVPDADQ